MNKFFLISLKHLDTRHRCLIELAGDCKNRHMSQF